MSRFREPYGVELVPLDCGCIQRVEYGAWFHRQIAFVGWVIGPVIGRDRAFRWSRALLSGPLGYARVVTA